MACWAWRIRSAHRRAGSFSTGLHHAGVGVVGHETQRPPGQAVGMGRSPSRRGLIGKPFRTWCWASGAATVTGCDQNRHSAGCRHRRDQRQFLSVHQQFRQVNGQIRPAPLVCCFGVARIARRADFDLAHRDVPFFAQSLQQPQSTRPPPAGCFVAHRTSTSVCDVVQGSFIKHRGNHFAVVAGARSGQAQRRTLGLRARHGHLVKLSMQSQLWVVANTCTSSCSDSSKMSCQSFSCTL